MQDDKKKMTVLGVLVLAIIGVGAFQMMPQAPEVPAGETHKKWAPPEDSVSAKMTVIPNPSVMYPLGKRDPFDVPPGADPDSAPPTPTPTQASSVRSTEMPPTIGSALPHPFGQFPSLPNTAIETGGGSTDTVAIQPEPPKKVDPPKPVEPVFNYTLSGVIVGQRPAAVLRDAQGQQRLIAEGTKIDADATLVQVRPHGVTVEIGGKQIRMEIQGNKDAH